MGKPHPGWQSPAYSSCQSRRIERDPALIRNCSSTSIWTPFTTCYMTSHLYIDCDGSGASAQCIQRGIRRYSSFAPIVLLFLMFSYYSWSSFVFVKNEDLVLPTYTAPPQPTVRFVVVPSSFICLFSYPHTHMRMRLRLCASAHRLPCLQLFVVWILLGLFGILKMVLHQPNPQPMPSAMGEHGNIHRILAHTPTELNNTTNGNPNPIVAISICVHGTRCALLMLGIPRQLITRSCKNK